MADPIRVSGPVSGTDKTLTFETGRFAPQSQGAVVASIGGTSVLTTANAAKEARPGMDFFPLTVDVEESALGALEREERQRVELGDLAAELGADGATGAGDEHPLASE